MTASKSKHRGKEEHEPDALKGWKEIASFLGEPTSVVQRWANEGMPVQRRGRFVTTTPDELNHWLGQESGKPVHVATPESDLTAELKRGISYLRYSRKAKTGADPSKPTKKTAA